MLTQDQQDELAFHLGEDWAEIWASFEDAFGEGNEPQNCIDAYRGQYDSEVACAQDFVDDCGYLDQIPENLRFYFDYEAFARDLFINDMTFGDKGHVFWNHW